MYFEDAPKPSPTLLKICAYVCNPLSLLSLLPISMSAKGESGSLCVSQEISVLSPKTEICSDMQAMFTWTDLDSCVSVPSVLLDSWVQANSTCSCSANPEIINQGGMGLYFLGLYPASSDLKQTSDGTC